MWMPIDTGTLGVTTVARVCSLWFRLSPCSVPVNQSSTLDHSVNALLIRLNHCADLFPTALFNHSLLCTVSNEGAFALHSLFSSRIVSPLHRNSHSRGLMKTEGESNIFQKFHHASKETNVMHCWTTYRNAKIASSMEC